MLIPANKDSKHIAEDAAVRDVLQKHGVVAVYLRHFGGKVIERSDPPQDAEATFAQALGLVAQATGRPEVKHCPWITLGKSSRGRFPFRTSWWFPDRVIASITYHGEVPTWPMQPWSKAGDENILHVAINGLTEWDGTWYRHVRPGLLNYHRNTGWLAHQVVLYGVGHGNYIDAHGSQGWGQKVPGRNISCIRVWGYIAKFIDRAMTLRVPSDVIATDGPIKLKSVDRSKGYLIHPRAIEEIMGLKWFAWRQNEKGDHTTIPWPDEPTPVFSKEQGSVPDHELILPAEAVPEAAWKDHLWIPDEAMARSWLRLHDIYKMSGRVLPKAQETTKP